MQVAMRVLTLLLIVCGFGRLTMIKLDLFKDQFFVLWDLKAKELKIEVKVLHGLTCGFVLLEVQPLQIWVRQSLFHGDPAIRVERQHFLNQVNCLLTGSTEQLIEVFALVAG